MRSISPHPALSGSDILQLAQEMVQNQAPNLTPSVDFSPEINARLVTAASTAQTAVSRANRQDIDAYLRFLMKAQKAAKKTSQVLWLTEAADKFSDAHKSNSACKKGCAHCCHIPLTIGIVEAESIAQVLGIKIAPKSQHIATPKIGTPCPFLKNNTCSIYKWRPLICRTHMSMDQDDLLCRLQGDGSSIPVPYVNNLDIMATAFEITGPQYADIRQWFSIGGKQ